MKKIARLQRCNECLQDNVKSGLLVANEHQRGLDV